MTPTENYCRQYHAQDVLSKGKCDMCGGTSVLGFEPRTDEDEPITEKEAQRVEIESHLHP
jgi:hypothetical protein